MLEPITKTTLYTISEVKVDYTDGTKFHFELYNPQTGEIVTGKNFEIVLRHLASEQGFYLRRK